MGPLQTHQIISSIQKRELGATDKIAAAANPIWKEIAEEKEFETFFPKTSSDSLPLPTPSILKGKSVEIPKFFSSDTPQSDAPISNNETANTKFSSKKSDSLGSSPGPQLSIHAKKTSPSTAAKSKKKAKLTSQKKKVSSNQPQKPTIDEAIPSEKTLIEKKQKRAIPKSISKTTQESKSAIRPEESPLEKSSSETKVVIVPDNTIKVISLPSDDTLSTKSELPLQVSADAPSGSLRVKPLETASSSSTGTQFPSNPLESNSISKTIDMSEKIFDTKTDFANKADSKEIRNDSHLKKLQLDSLSEILQDLPSRQLFRNPSGESHELSTSKEADPLHVRSANSLSRQLNQPKTIQINLTISKLSISLLFMACLAIGLGIFGIFEYEKMRDLKDSHLPDPSSPTIELSTTDDPIPSLKAPTRPKRE